MLVIWRYNVCMVKSNCKQCGKEVIRNGSVPGTFCDMTCKAEWQKSQKPVDKEWLIQKYIVEKLGTYEIGKLIGRNPKRVYEWLIGYGIPTRKKSDSIAEMNRRESTRRKRSDSSKRRKVTDESRGKMSLSKRGIPNLKIRGAGNGMYGRRGARSPQWSGGTTPERQALYSSIEWKNVIEKVWKRDNGICSKCQKKYIWGDQFHIHHIKSFSLYPELRSELNNLVLLCSDCHHWVHSAKNVGKEFIIDQPSI